MQLLLLFLYGSELFMFGFWTVRWTKQATLTMSCLGAQKFLRRQDLVIEMIENGNTDDLILLYF